MIKSKPEIMSSNPDSIIHHISVKYFKLEPYGKDENSIVSVEKKWYTPLVRYFLLPRNLFQ
jgi:hypothetical protein